MAGSFENRVRCAFRLRSPSFITGALFGVDEKRTNFPDPDESCSALAMADFSTFRATSHLFRREFQNVQGLVYLLSLISLQI